MASTKKVSGYDMEEMSTWKNGDVLTSAALNHIQTNVDRLWDAVGSFNIVGSNSGSGYNLVTKEYLNYSVGENDPDGKKPGALKTIASLSQVDGIISATYQEIPKASTSQFGVVKIKAGDNLIINNEALATVTSPVFSEGLTVGTNNNDSADPWPVSNMINLHGLTHLYQLEVASTLDDTGNPPYIFTKLHGKTEMSFLYIEDVCSIYKNSTGGMASFGASTVKFWESNFSILQKVGNISKPFLEVNNQYQLIFGALSDNNECLGTAIFNTATTTIHGNTTIDNLTVNNLPTYIPGANNRNYGVQVASNGSLYVNVPWEDPSGTIPTYAITYNDPSLSYSFRTIPEIKHYFSCGGSNITQYDYFTNTLEIFESIHDSTQSISLFAYEPVTKILTIGGGTHVYLQASYSKDITLYGKSIWMEGTTTFYDYPRLPGLVFHNPQDGANTANDIHLSQAQIKTIKEYFNMPLQEDGSGSSNVPNG